jgi:peptide-methionine (S)-S-oxide reductase
MKKMKIFSRAAAAAAAAALLYLGVTLASANFPEPPAEPITAKPENRTAVLAGGCFWGVEGVFERLNGVVDVVSGYSGGDEMTARYELVSMGNTGHAESVRIVYDPSRVSYGTLLKVFFSVAHDPTQLNSQGPDVGTQYRSAIFYATVEQKRVAEEYIRALEKSGVFNKKIATQVVPLKEFYPAEDYHQDFMDKNPDYPYVVFWDLPKIAHLEKEFPELLNRP